MNAATHAFTPAPAAPLGADEFARRPGDETHPLARNHGPDWRAALEIKDHPYAETDEGDFYSFFGSEAWDAAPDLTRPAGSYIPQVPL